MLPIFLFSFLLSGFALPQEVGKFSVLLVSDGEAVSSTDVIMKRLNELSSRQGKGGTGLPLRQLYPQNTAKFEKLLQRLGVNRAELPVLGVVSWNSTESLGPRRFVGDAFARRASRADVPRVIQSYLSLSGRTRSVLPPFFMADRLPLAEETGLKMEAVRFEASGSPLFVTNMAARIANDSFTTVQNVRVRFYLRIDTGSPWKQVSEKRVPKIASHQSVSVDVLADSKDLGLLDQQDNAVRCQYKIEVQVPGGQALVRVGVFVPSEEPIS